MLSDKQVLALIKKTQKKLEQDEKKLKRRNTPKDEVEVEEPSNEIFNEMKKRPFTE